MRVNTIRHRAWLAWRLPPGLRRWRTVLPDDAGIGAAGHMCAAAPIPASSGKTVRHRLNPGGNRQANHALWRIVFTRMGSHPATRAYVERRTAEGKSKAET